MNDFAVLIEQLRHERERVIIAIDGGTALGKSASVAAGTIVPTVVARSRRP